MEKGFLSRKRENMGKECRTGKQKDAQPDGIGGA